MYISLKAQVFYILEVFHLVQSEQAIGSVPVISTVPGARPGVIGLL